MPRLLLKATTVLFLLLMLIANFYCFRGIKKHGLEAYFYQRMLVAYEVGRGEGVRSELARLFAGDRMPAELYLAREFEGSLASIKDPQGYLREALERSIKKVNLLQEVRNIAIVLIFILIILRVLLKRIA